jgi:hypothetical protein
MMAMAWAQQCTAWLWRGLFFLSAEGAAGGGLGGFEGGGGREVGVRAEEGDDFGVVAHERQGEGVLAFPVGAFGADECVGAVLEEKLDGLEVALGGGDVQRPAADVGGIDLSAVGEGDFHELDAAGPGELAEGEGGVGAVVEEQLDHLGMIGVDHELDAVGTLGIDLFGVSGEVGVDGPGESEGAGHEELGLNAAGHEKLEDVDFAAMSGGALGGFIAGLGLEGVHGFDEFGVGVKHGLDLGHIAMGGGDDGGSVDERLGFFWGHHTVPSNTRAKGQTRQDHIQALSPKTISRRGGARIGAGKWCACQGHCNADTPMCQMLSVCE